MVDISNLQSYINIYRKKPIFFYAHGHPEEEFQQKLTGARRASSGEGRFPTRLPEQKLEFSAPEETQKRESVWVAIVTKVLYTDTIGNNMQWITEGESKIWMED